MCTVMPSCLTVGIFTAVLQPLSPESQWVLDMNDFRLVEESKLSSLFFSKEVVLCPKLQLSGTEFSIKISLK